jgi:hypothetical protein
MNSCARLARARSPLLIRTFPNTLPGPRSDRDSRHSRWLPIAVIAGKVAQTSREMPAMIRPRVVLEDPDHQGGVIRQDPPRLLHSQQPRLVFRGAGQGRSIR